MLLLNNYLVIQCLNSILLITFLLISRIFLKQFPSSKDSPVAGLSWAEKHRKKTLINKLRAKGIHCRNEYEQQIIDRVSAQFGGNLSEDEVIEKLESNQPEGSSDGSFEDATQRMGNPSVEVTGKHPLTPAIPLGYHVFMDEPSPTREKTERLFVKYDNNRRPVHTSENPRMPSTPLKGGSDRVRVHFQQEPSFVNPSAKQSIPQRTEPLAPVEVRRDNISMIAIICLVVLVFVTLISMLGFATYIFVFSQSSRVVMLSDDGYHVFPSTQSSLVSPDPVTFTPIEPSSTPGEVLTSPLEVLVTDFSCYNYKHFYLCTEVAGDSCMLVFSTYPDQRKAKIIRLDRELRFDSETEQMSFKKMCSNPDRMFRFLP